MKPMRIAIVDESAARAAVIAEGLAASGLTDITVLIERRGLVARLQSLSPDVVLIDLANPSRDELEELFAVTRAISRPIAMFVDQSDDSSIEAAIDAGVSAYVVDGMKPDRIRSVLDVAIKRFNAFARLAGIGIYRPQQDACILRGDDGRPVRHFGHYQSASQVR
jgi:two-component system, response regulator / RNA-binding antiterminator